MTIWLLRGVVRIFLKKSCMQSLEKEKNRAAYSRKTNSARKSPKQKNSNIGGKIVLYFYGWKKILFVRLGEKQFGLNFQTFSFHPVPFLKNPMVLPLSLICECKMIKPLHGGVWLNSWCSETLLLAFSTMCFFKILILLYFTKWQVLLALMPCIPHLFNLFSYISVRLTNVRKISMSLNSINLILVIGNSN